MDIWSFQHTLTKRLKIWAVLSVICGALMQFTSDRGRGAGTQFFGWGIINLLIAWFGHRNTTSKYQALENPYDPHVMQQEKVGLRRLLIINSGLDVLYILGGRNLAAQKSGRSPYLRGIGAGIIIQGAYLLIFDLLHVYFLARLADTQDTVIYE